MLISFRWPHRIASSTPKPNLPALAALFGVSPPPIKMGIFGCTGRRAIAASCIEGRNFPSQVTYSCCSIAIKDPCVLQKVRHSHRGYSQKARKIQ